MADDLLPTPAERRTILPTLPAGARPCSRCSQPVEPGRKDNYCRPCRALYARERRKRLKAEGGGEERRERQRQLNLERKRAILAAMRRSACSRCGFEPQTDAELSVLDFHHVDPAEKSFEISPSSTRSLDSLIEEARKCQILCANCHRIVHYENGGTNIHRRKAAGPRRYADPQGPSWTW